MIRESFFVNKEISENIAKTIVDIPHGNSDTETFICLDYMGIGHKDKSFSVSSFADLAAAATNGVWSGNDPENTAGVKLRHSKCDDCLLLQVGKLSFMLEVVDPTDSRFGENRTNPIVAIHWINRHAPKVELRWGATDNDIEYMIDWRTILSWVVSEPTFGGIKQFLVDLSKAVKDCRDEMIVIQVEAAIGVLENHARLYTFPFRTQAYTHSRIVGNAAPSEEGWNMWCNYINKEVGGEKVTERMTSADHPQLDRYFVAIESAPQGDNEKYDSLHAGIYTLGELSRQPLCEVENPTCYAIVNALAKWVRASKEKENQPE